MGAAWLPDALIAALDQRRIRAVQSQSNPGNADLLLRHLEASDPNVARRAQEADLVLFVINEHPDHLALCFSILKSIVRTDHPNRVVIAACTIFDHPQSPDTARRAMVALNRAAREFLHLELQCLGSVHHDPRMENKQDIRRNDREVRTVARRLAARLRVARSRQHQFRLVVSANG